LDIETTQQIMPFFKSNTKKDQADDDIGAMSNSSSSPSPAKQKKPLVSTPTVISANAPSKLLANIYTEGIPSTLWPYIKLGKKFSDKASSPMELTSCTIQVECNMIASVKMIFDFFMDGLYIYFEIYILN
jgi:hypothetical protein